MNLTTRFTEEFVSLAKSYSDDADESAATLGGGRFADYAMITFHGLRIFLEETYEMLIDRLEVMPPILEIIGLESDDLPHPSTVNKWLGSLRATPHVRDRQLGGQALAGRRPASAVMVSRIPRSCSDVCSLQHKENRQTTHSASLKRLNTVE